jgi:tetratricopeptide (TPR) repeat protein
MHILFEEANKKLKEGEFESSKRIFSSLLDEEPENKDFIVGFFTSSYWDNRLEKIFSTKEGRERGLLLDKMFKSFEKDFLSRGYSKNQTYESTLFCVLTESCSQLRQGFLNEGRQALDKDILIILSKNLLRIKDYKNSYDLIQYFSKYHDLPPEYYFYRAECLYHLGELKKSLVLFRSSFLHFPDFFDSDFIQSEPFAKIWHDLSEDFPEVEKRKEYLPVFCLEKNFLPEMEDYSKDDISMLLSEMTRLDAGRKTANQEVIFKLNYRIIQYGLTILDSFHAQVNSELTKKVRELVQSIDSGILERRTQTQKTKERQIKEI